MQHPKQDWLQYQINSIKKKISNVISVDSSLSTTSTNPVQNKVVTADLAKKVDSADFDTFTKEIDKTKQDKLVSGINIKSINGISLLGSGNINIEGGGGTSQVFEDVTSLPSEPDKQKIYRIKNIPNIYTYMDSTLLTIEEIIRLAEQESDGDIKVDSVNIILVTTLPNEPLTVIAINPLSQAYIFNIYVMNDDVYGCIVGDSGEIIWFKNDELSTFNICTGYGGVIDSLDITNNMIDGYIYLYYSVGDYVNYNGSDFVKLNSNNDYLTKIFTNITNVSEIPDNIWKGTNIPKNSYIETVYVNTSITRTEFRKIVSDLEYIDLTALGGTEQDYPILVTDNGHGMLLTKNEYGYHLNAVNLSTMETTLLYSTNSEFIIDTSSYTFNGNSISSFGGVEVGLQNDKLTGVVSISSEFKKDVSDDNTIYRTTPSDSTLYQFEDGMYIDALQELKDAGVIINLIQVDDFPEEPFNVLVLDGSVITMTLYIINNEIYGYNGTEWLGGNALAEFFGCSGYGGVITNFSKGGKKGFIYLYLGDSGRYIATNNGSIFEFVSKDDIKNCELLIEEAQSTANTAFNNLKNNLENNLNNKQDILVSGENIKTINDQSILGSGNITIVGGTTFFDVSNYVDSTLPQDILEPIRNNPSQCLLIIKNHDYPIILSYHYNNENILYYYGSYISCEENTIASYSYAVNGDSGTFTEYDEFVDNISNVTEQRVNELIDAKITNAINSRY